MMIATERAMPGSSGSGAGRTDRSVRMRGRRFKLTEAEVGLLDRLLDGLQGGGIERLHRQQARLRRPDRGEVLERRRGPVVLDLDPVEERGGGATGSDAVELVARALDRLVHPAGGVG